VEIMKNAFWRNHFDRPLLASLLIRRGKWNDANCYNIRVESGVDSISFGTFSWALILSLCCAAFWA
jgi:hypothetical protein